MENGLAFGVRSSPYYLANGVRDKIDLEETGFRWC